ncbi:MAG: acyl-CoA thioesterase [Thermomicrobiales bacterium]
MADDVAATHDADEETKPESHADSPRFAAYFKVRHYEMDALGHVNNAIYLHYLEQAAYEHSAAAGFSDERTQALGGMWIVRRHEIEYLRPATAGDVLQVVTWAVEFKGARAVRDYAIFRYEGQSGNPHALPADGFLPPTQELSADPLVRAQTLWVWADVLTARPRRIPAVLYPAFFG